MASSRDTRRPDRSSSRHVPPAPSPRHSVHSPRISHRPEPLQFPDSERLRERFSFARQSPSPRQSVFTNPRSATLRPPPSPARPYGYPNQYVAPPFSPLAPAPGYPPPVPPFAPMPPPPSPRQRPPSQPRPHTPLYTADEIQQHVAAELDVVYGIIQTVVHREFRIPPELQPVKLDIRLSRADLDPDSTSSSNNNAWRYGRGPLHDLTEGAAIYTPTIVVYLPPVPPRSKDAGSRRASATGPSRHLRDAAMRVLQTLRNGTEPATRGVPLRPDSDIVHSSVEIVDAAGDTSHAMWPVSMVYVPRRLRDRDGRRVIMYEQLLTEGSSGRARLGRWADRWKIDLREILGDKAFVRGGYEIVEPR